MNSVFESVVCLLTCLPGWPVCRFGFGSVVSPPPESCEETSTMDRQIIAVSIVTTLSVGKNVLYSLKKERKKGVFQKHEGSFVTESPRAHLHVVGMLRFMSLT